MDDVTQEQTEHTEESAVDPSLECQNELTEATNRLKYLQAEFDNYKKRSAKERILWSEIAQAEVLVTVLGLVDDIDRALSELEAQELPAEVQVHFEGFSLIGKSCVKLLEKFGVEEIPYQKEFDPTFFEAVMKQESADHQEGEIVAILQKGYQRNGRVLRPAKVSVAQ